MATVDVVIPVHNEELSLRGCLEVLSRHLTNLMAALAEAHGGRVELRTNDRGGSTFVLVLPLS